jgi:ribosomal-protein-alanine N-acetyltransferase
MLQLNFTPFPILRTSRLILRQMTKKDAEAVFILRSDPVINKYIHRQAAKSMTDAYDFIEKITNNQLNNSAIQWAITHSDSDKLIGNICLWNIDSQNNTAELGYSLLTDYFKQGIMHEALQAVKDYGFNVMKVMRIDAFTNKDNTASLKLLAKNGFKRNQALEHALQDQSELEYNQIYSLAKEIQ